MSTWPVSLPSYPLVNGFSESIPETTVRTEMDQGPAKIRQRTTASIRKMQMSFLLNKTQTQALDTFYITTLNGGSTSFTFTHPRTDASISCRFTQPPEYTSTNGDYFNAGIELEILP